MPKIENVIQEKNEEHRRSENAESGHSAANTIQVRMRGPSPPGTRAREGRVAGGGRAPGAPDSHLYRVGRGVARVSILTSILLAAESQLLSKENAAFIKKKLKYGHPRNGFSVFEEKQSIKYM